MKKVKRYNLAVFPGSSKNNKTGSWRTFRPVVDHEKCIGCAKCEQVCPEGVCFAVKNTPLAPLVRGELGNTPQSLGGDRCCGGKKNHRPVSPTASRGGLTPSSRQNGGQAPEGEQKVYYENDLDYCKGCGICARECPAHAIRMEREEK